MTNKELKKKLQDKANKLEDLPIRTVDEHNAYIKEIQSKELPPRLSILIPTTIDRREMFNILMLEFHKQIEMFGFAGKGLERWYVKAERLNEDGSIMMDGDKPVTDLATARYRHKAEIEILFEEDNKELSIGAKRNKLLERAKGEYVAFFDSDDFPEGNYIKLVMEGVEAGTDCISLRGRMTTNGEKPELFEHSLKYKHWETTKNLIKYERYPNHLNPIKATIAKQFKFDDINFGEDHKWSKLISESGLLKTEHFIDHILYNYRYVTNK